MDAWFEFGKQFGFPALCLAAVGFAFWRSCRWFATKIAEPLAERLGTAAVAVRDDVADVKETVSRIEKRQTEHFEICAGVPPRPAKPAPA